MLFIALGFIVAGCQSVPDTYDTRFTRSEIASFTASNFDGLEGTAARALRPTYEKYGAPHIYVSGYMSSVNDPEISRLYGSGEATTKLRPRAHTFWTVEGAGLSQHLDPIQTAHLIYDVDRLDRLRDRLSAIGSLSNRGKVLPVFERQIDGQIVVTLHPTDALRSGSRLETLSFFHH